MLPARYKNPRLQADTIGSKEKLPARSQVALGGHFNLQHEGGNCMEIMLPADKKEKYECRMRAVIDSSCCPPALAAKVGGYIQTIASRQWGRCARSYAWPVYDHANDGWSDELSPRLRWSILVLMRLFREARPRIVRPLMCRPIAVLYFDSCGKPECLAGIFLSPTTAFPGAYFSTHIDAHLSEFLDPTIEENRDTQLHLPH